MRRAICIVITTVLALGLLGIVPQAVADEISLAQAIEKVESETKALVVRAATAGSYHQIVAIGGGKTKFFKVGRGKGDVELSREKDWSDKSAKIVANAKVACSSAVASAVEKCKGDLRSVKASLNKNGSVEFLVCVRTKAKGDLKATVCALSGKVGAVEATEGAPTEGCE